METADREIIMLALDASVAARGRDPVAQRQWLDRAIPDPETRVAVLLTLAAMLPIDMVNLRQISRVFVDGTGLTVDPELRAAHAAWRRGVRDPETAMGQRAYERQIKRLARLRRSVL